MSDYEYVDSNWCPDCGEMRGICRCDEVANEPDGDECPNCLSRNTERIDIIVNDPEVWACQCGYCGQVFEVVTGEYSHGG